METQYIILLTVLLTLITYSLISLSIHVISRENDDVLEFFGMGVVGWVILLILIPIFKIIKYIEHYNKRSIFEEKDTDKQYNCKLKDTDDIIYWTEGYKLIKRYADKSEWTFTQDFSKEFIDKSKINCSHCKYDDECQRHEPKCMHNTFGQVLEFNKFEKEN